MKKSYCDSCNSEITKGNFYTMNGLDVDILGMKFSVKPPNEAPIDFDICKHCVIDAVNKLDDRPKCEANQ